MAIRHVFNWAAWRATMRAKAFKAGAEGVTATLGAWFGTNAISTLPADVLKGVGMSWKQAFAMLAASVLIRMLYAVALFVQQNPEPEEVEERTTHDAMTATIKLIPTQPPGPPPPNT